MFNLDDITGGYTSTQKLNENFQKVEEWINVNALWRNGLEAGQANQMNNNLDMNGNVLLNTKVYLEDGSSLVDLSPYLQQLKDAAENNADLAQFYSTQSQNSASLSQRYALDAEKAKKASIAAAQASGVARIFSTYALAAASTTLEEGDLVEVVFDETRDGDVSRYVYEGGSLVFKWQPGVRNVTANGVTKTQEEWASDPNESNVTTTLGDERSLESWANQIVDTESRLTDVEGEYIASVDSVAELRGLTGKYEGQPVVVKRYFADGPGDAFRAYWTSNTGLTDDGLGVFTTTNGAWQAPTERRINAFRGGVKGDGATDDSPAFQRCFDYLSSQGGGEVYVSAGYSYAIRPFGTDCCFNVWENCSLIGNGNSSAFFIPPDATPNSYIFIPIRIGDGSTGANNVTIKDIYINCNQEAIFGIRGAATGFMFAIGARHEVDLTASSSDVTIEGCTVQDSNIAISCSKNGSDGLFYEQTRRDSVFRRWTATRNHIFKTNNKAIEFQEAASSSIDHNTGEQVWDGPQFIFGCSNSQIINNTMSYILTGINVTHGANGILVDGNNMIAEGTGGDGKAAMILRVEPLVADSSINAIENVIISNNRFVDNKSLATRAFMMETRAQTTSAAFRNVSLISNIFDGNVYLYDFGGNTNSTFSDALIEGNQFRRTVFTVDTQPVLRISFIGNRVENNLNWRIDNGFISSNRFINGFNFDSRGTGNQYVANNIATPTGDITNNTIR